MRKYNSAVKEGIPAYIINLEKRTDRKEHILKGISGKE